MSSLPPALNFAETEEEIVKKWKDEDSFRLQNKLSLERGDEVRGMGGVCSFGAFLVQMCVSYRLFLFRSTLFTTALHLLPVCLTMGIFWLEPSRIRSHGMRP
jgi:hypothetical protein